ncbi:lipopolysaccharide transport periplasmic protein [Oryzomicrobium terrae]|uniref:Lipopolysaccharide export system protein LptA n=1 Tax=Oryzomicrobium terrae TaxID=1735038 RepID=A0A5C1ECG4_9RHOO|nr:lipopolysaccharide transport periplasmic protein LptA [Oryzomicrobium terrae]QEL65968.1 lipopolysaccharide transport periplasmic protein [Oryzomicrobium terrae]
MTATFHSSRPVLLLSLALALHMLMATAPARAEKADKEKPVNLEADRVSADDARKVYTFEGNVRLVQGTMSLLADRVVVTQDESGFQKGVAYGLNGKLAKFRQKREGKDEWIDGEAERIDHDAKTDTTELFIRAWVKSGQDEVRGPYIRYDALTEQYLVASAPGAKPTASGTAPGAAPAGRVRAILQPKGKGADTAAPTGTTKGDGLPLKSAPTVNTDR